MLRGGGRDGIWKNQGKQINAVPAGKEAPGLELENNFLSITTVIISYNCNQFLFECILPENKKSTVQLKWSLASDHYPGGWRLSYGKLSTNSQAVDFLALLAFNIARVN